MALFARLFGRNKRPPDQAVLVHLDGVGLPDAVYEEYDLATIEDQLSSAVTRDGTGDFDGNEVGQGGATLFMYGPDAERLFRTVEPVLRAYPLCRGARAVIRAGGPGGRERELKLE
jgi:hypothetical protein